MRLSSRAALVSAALVAGLVTVPAAHAAPTSTSGDYGPVVTHTAGGVPLPTSGVYLGSAVNSVVEGVTWAEAFDAFEDTTGRDLALHRTYQSWEGTTISNLTKLDTKNGRIPAVSIEAPVWAELASGARDAEVVAQAQAFKAFGKPVLLSLNHEPEIDTGTLGTPQQYRDAWRRWAGIYRAQGVTNVSLTWIVLASSFGRDAAVAESYYPGDDVVDWLGVDGYNWYDVCKTSRWRTFDEVFAGFRTWAAKHPKPIFIAEVGSAEDSADPQRKARWVQEMGASLQTWPQVKALSWFHFQPTEGSALRECGFRLNSSPASMDAWRSVAASPHASRSLVGLGEPVAQPVAEPPVVTVDVRGNAVVDAPVTSTGSRADVTVTVAPAGAAARTAGAASTGSTTSLTVGSTIAPSAVQVAVPGLLPRATYTASVVVTNAAGSMRSTTTTFTTTGTPVPVLHPAHSVEVDRAVLSGTVEPGGLATTVTFDYGLTPAYGSSTRVVKLAAGTAAVPVALPVARLTRGTTYHVRMRATNEAGTVESTGTFTTVALPKATTQWSARINRSTVGLHGTVVAAGLPTTWHFEYGTTTAYGRSSVPLVVVGGTKAVPVETRLTPLAPGTYHYRLVAVNAAGRSVGEDRTVTLG